MDKAFLRSREFLITGIVALLLVAGWGTAMAVVLVGGPLYTSTTCGNPTVPGTPLEAQGAETLGESPGGHHTREITYTIPTAEVGAVHASLCVAVGEITLRPSSTGDARLIVTVEADGINADRAARELEVATRATTSGNALHLATHQMESERHLWALWGLQTEIEVRIVLEVPATLPLTLAFASDVGDVGLSGVTLASLDGRAEVGNIAGDALTLAGPTAVTTQVGDVTLAFRNATAGSVRVTTEVGDATVHLPRAEDVGYDVTAAAEVGEVTLDLGPTELHDSRADTPGERATARTMGYGAAPVKVGVTVATEVGDIQVITR